MGKKKGPGFVKLDENKIQETEGQGGLSDGTKAARKSALNIYDTYMEFNQKPGLEDVCSKIKEKMETSGLDDDVKVLIKALEDDLKGFFQTYYVQLAESGENENIEDQTEEELESLDQNEEEAKKNEEENKENIRPRGNTSLSKKSHLKMLILDFTDHKLDITNPAIFPNFNVSTYFFVILHKKKYFGS